MYKCCHYGKLLINQRKHLEIHWMLTKICTLSQAFQYKTRPESSKTWIECFLSQVGFGKIRSFVIPRLIKSFFLPYSNFTLFIVKIQVPNISIVIEAM